MHVMIRIQCDNAAFSDGLSGHETSRILEELSHRIGDSVLYPGMSITLMDVNGNKVGEFKCYKKYYKR